MSGQSLSEPILTLRAYYRWWIKLKGIERRTQERVCLWPKGSWWQEFSVASDSMEEMQCNRPLSRSRAKKPSCPRNHAELAKLFNKAVTISFQKPPDPPILGLHCTSKYLSPSALPEPGTPAPSSLQLAEKRLPWAPSGPLVFCDDSLQLSSGSRTSFACVIDPSPLALSAPLLCASGRVWASSRAGTLSFFLEHWSCLSAVSQTPGLG